MESGPYVLAIRLLYFWRVQPQHRRAAMTKTEEAANGNAIQQGLVPMLRIWGRSIGWTVILSAAGAVLFALLLDGCSRIRR